jgi:hypothetical protein
MRREEPDVHDDPAYADLNNSDVHYRLYRSHDTNEPVVICVQWFDYPDYDKARFLTEDRYSTESEAETARSDYVAENAPRIIYVPVYIPVPVPLI